MQKRILILDDNEEILFLCKIILKKYNYFVETRRHCDNIISDAVEVMPDIIILDLKIPMMGGERALRLVKSHPRTLHIPVILFSGNRDLEAVALRNNNNPFLAKPFDHKVLLSMIAENLVENALL